LRVHTKAPGPRVGGFRHGGHHPGVLRPAIPRES